MITSSRLVPAAVLLAISLFAAAPAAAQLRVNSLCRVKGQEKNTLVGYGLVVGLNGTGDGDKPTVRQLANLLSQMGNAMGSPNAPGGINLDDLKSARNVAQVMVTAVIRGEGGREGGELDCTVTAISAKSLDGGYLLPAPLLGPHPQDNTVYAMAQGKISLENSRIPTMARVASGTRLLADFYSPFVENDTITLVVHPNHASFRVAQDIEHVINNHLDFRLNASSDDQEIAKALDAKNIVVQIPKKYADRPVQFVNSVLELPIISHGMDATVVVNTRTGIIVVGQDVQFRPVMVRINGVTVSAEAPQGAGSEFVAVNPEALNGTTRLAALVDALNALKVPSREMIEVIRHIHRGGNLYADLIVE